jgi:hypothetical protein
MVLAVYSEDNDLEVMLEPCRACKGASTTTSTLLLVVDRGYKTFEFILLTAFDLVRGVRSIHFLNFCLGTWVCTSYSTDAASMSASL